ncbi:curved DNA-binding protein [Serratia sp. UGAL515B_01]|uniref:curved DNA-binding protein n=1 Tax=Serratia sp. UGAL515B_01 TaxID=2986763 RepID=UPI002952EAD7|nr:curved DNA-binding protein [Serratia sp. UGAL515B_01]WON78304.1 curved DNA-binding protein [Serratia sp. UGAL515B_01]
MEFKDYYAILGLKPSDDIKAIKTAYRRLARKFHPDVSTEANAEERFKDVAEAYEVLKDSQRRAEYDELLRHRNNPNFGRQAKAQRHRRGETEDFSDIFSTMFGHEGRGRQQRPAHGRDVEIGVTLLLEETLGEQTRTLSYKVPIYNAFGLVEKEISKTLNVKIPLGVGDGERIRVKGQGVPGIAGGANGDLYLNIKFAPHSLFDVVGLDLEIVLQLAPWEAALGRKISLPTLSESILLSVPAGSQAGQRLRIKGKGLTGKKETGNLYAVIKIVIPQKSDDESIALWQQLAEANKTFDPRIAWSK